MLTKKECKKRGMRVEVRMMIVPVPFSTEGGLMLQYTKRPMEEPDDDGTSLIAIHKERFPKLVTALRTAVANDGAARRRRRTRRLFRRGIDSRSSNLVFTLNSPSHQDL
jgi:hypothetical protein